MKLTFVIPCFNAGPNLSDLLASLFEQNDKDWSAIFIDDMSTDDETVHTLKGINDDRIKVIINTEKKFALRNIIETAKKCDGIIAVIDGDDQLCNPNTVSLIKAAHAEPKSVVWTAHKWDINGMNVSKPMPDRVNPYQYQWSASHLRTFDSSLLNEIPDSNFKDHNGLWFERGYDQALMLPLLFKAHHRKYIPDVCYLYKINSCSVVDRDWSEIKQLKTVNFVRSRGYIS